MNQRAVSSRLATPLCSARLGRRVLASALLASVCAVVTRAETDPAWSAIQAIENYTPTLPDLPGDQALQENTFGFSKTNHRAKAGSASWEPSDTSSHNSGVASIASNLPVADFSPFAGPVLSTTKTYSLSGFSATQVNTNSNYFAGSFTNGSGELQQFANGAGSPFPGNPGTAAIFTLTTSGAQGGTARSMQIGDSFTITNFVNNSSSFFSGGSIGIKFLDATSYSVPSGNDLSSNSANNVRAYVQLNQNGNYFGGGTTTNSPGLGAGTDRTFTITITSSNTFNLTIAGTTYYNLTMLGSPTDTSRIQSFVIYNQTSGNTNDSFWKNASLADTGSVTFDTGGGSTMVSGLIADGLDAGSITTTRANALVKNGSNTLTLTNNNSYSGGTTVNAGTVQIGNGGTTGTPGSGTITLTPNTTLAFNRTDSPSFSNPVALSGTANLQANAGFFNVAANTTAKLTGAITSNGQELWKSGSGTLVVNNSANSFNTSVVIQSGVLETDSLSDNGSNSSLGKGSIFISQTSASTLRYTGATGTTDRIGTLALQGASGTNSTIEVTNSATTLTVSSNIGSLNSNNGLIKTGAGILALTGSNTYSGTTAVNNGTLQAGVNSLVSVGNGVTVNSGGTLLLSGAGRHLGNAVGVTLNGGTFNTGGLSEPSTTAGSGNIGALTLTATSTINFGTGNSSILEFGGVGAHTAGTILQITNWDGTPVTGGNGDRLLFSGTATDFTLKYNQSDVSFNGTSGYAVVPFSGYYEVTGLVPVPEPTTVLGGLLALGTLGYSQRRRLGALLHGLRRVA